MSDTYHNEEQMASVGKQVIALFSLPEATDPRTDKRYTPPRYDTTWGNKTAVGLGAVIVRIVNHAKDE